MRGINSAVNGIFTDEAASLNAYISADGILTVLSENAIISVYDYTGRK